MSNRANAIEVPLKCGECGNEFKIYVDGAPSIQIRVICTCGNAIERNYAPHLATKYRGFGVRAPAALGPAADLKVWSDGQ